VSERLNPYKSAPDAVEAMLNLEKYIQNCGLEKSLIHLVKMRASQINHCAFCLDMHSREARKDGETEQRLYVLPAWTEALTLISQTHAPDDDYEAAHAQFDDAELTKLTLLIGAINTWNRIAIGFRAPLPVGKAA
jgi:AhpD family alkylhydroperoxidase